MRIVWAEAARNDLDAIQAYIHERSRKGAQRVWVRIVERVALQAATPQAAPLTGVEDLRRLVISGTPYVVFYRIAAADLVVEAVMHAARDL